MLVERLFETETRPTGVEILVAGNRGFCEGVKYATSILWMVHQENRKKNPEATTYCIHPIVHNTVVTEAFIREGIAFVVSARDVPYRATVVFSAHGHPQDEYDIAKERELDYVDATCPLVIKVHKEARLYKRRGYHIIYLGQKGHREAIGVMSEVQDNSTLFIPGQDVYSLALDPSTKYAVLSQTTLDYAEVLRTKEHLRKRADSEKLAMEMADDICFATKNRQGAVYDFIKRGATIVLAVGSYESSNTKKLVKVAQEMGVPAHLIEKAEQITPDVLRGHLKVGITSGASAPETQLREILLKIRLLSGAAITEIEPLVDETDKDFQLPGDLQKIYDQYAATQPNWENNLYTTTLR